MTADPGNHLEITAATVARRRRGAIAGSGESCPARATRSWGVHAVRRSGLGPLDAPYEPIPSLTGCSATTPAARLIAAVGGVDAGGTAGRTTRRRSIFSVPGCDSVASNVAGNEERARSSMHALASS